MKLTKTVNWGTFIVDRAKRLRFTVKQSIDGAALSVVDLSESTAKVYFRASTLPADSLTASNYLVNSALTKSDGTNGLIDDRVTFTAAYGEVECELTLVDEAVAAATTPSGYREEVLKRWRAEVIASVQPDA